MNDDLNKLYTALRDAGYTVREIGDENRFREKMADKQNRQDLYNYVASRGDDLGDYDEYERRTSSAISSPSPDKSQYTFTEGQIGAMVTIIFGCLVLLFFVIKRHKDKMKINFYISALLKSVIIGVIVFLISFFALEALSLARRYVEAKEYDARYEYSGGIVIDKKEHKYYVIEENK